jgi:hypothetical protein
MKHNSVEQFKVGNLTVRIEYDHDPESPRDWDNMGTMVCFHRRHALGDEHNYKQDPNEFLQSLAGEHFMDIEDYLDNKLYKRMVKAAYDEPGYTEQRKVWSEKKWEIIWSTIHKHNLILPLGLYDHSGITMYIGSEPIDVGGWDSGQVGWIYASHKRLREEYGGRLTKKRMERAEKCLRQEVATYDEFLTGQVYGYVIEAEDGRDVDSSWGFYGLDYCRKEAKSSAEYAIQREANESKKVEEMMRL